MFFNIAATVVAGLVGITSASPLNLEPRQDECVAGSSDAGLPSGPIVQLIIQTQVVSYPVYIDTYIASNTIININGGVTININNAPTSLVTTVIAISTTTITSTV
jgi:hypothetical protein